MIYTLKLIKDRSVSTQMIKRGTCGCPILPREREAISFGSDLYRVKEILWDYNLDTLTVTAVYEPEPED
jgi:hypothetical protein